MYARECSNRVLTLQLAVFEDSEVYFADVLSSIDSSSSQLNSHSNVEEDVSSSSEEHFIGDARCGG